MTEECPECGEVFDSARGLSVHQTKTHEQPSPRDKPWHDKDKLKELYIEKELSLADVAERLGCSVSCILDWMEEYGIETRSVSEGMSDPDEGAPWRDRDLLDKLYVQNEMSAQKIADKLNCSAGTIYDWIKKLGVERPSASPDEIRDLMKCGMGLKEAADELEMSTAKLRTKVNEYSIGEHTCPTCGDHFWSQTGARAHHKRIHEESIAGFEKTCKVCGDEFTAQTKGRVCCSRECVTQVVSDTHSGENSWRWKPRVEVDCANCGNTIRREQRFVEEHRQFCDQDCENAWRSEHYSGSDSPLYDSVEVECSWCGSVLERQRHRVDTHTHQFCDAGCHGKWRSENRCGENSPHFDGGPANYGKGWNDKKKRDVRIRDQARCQNCGRTEAEHIELFGQKHVVHHIRPAKKVDNPEVRNSMENLTTLCCGGCHQLWEKMAPLRPDTANAAAD